LALFVPLHRASCAIVTGKLAASSFSTLFKGKRRAYSIPYLFDLSEFLCCPIRFPRDSGTGFLFCGQLIFRKGIDVLCAAADRLFQSHSRASLTVVGDGPERPRVEELKRRFPDRVSVRGFVPFKERAQVYRDADVFVFPSRHDGWGMAVHEAMASGMPVISSLTVGAAYDLIEDRINGLLAGPGSLDEYYNAMRFFTEHFDQIPLYGKRARSKAMELTPAWGAEELATIVSLLTAAKGEL